MSAVNLLLVYILLAFAAASALDTLPPLLTFSEWMQVHNKRYVNENEYRQREGIFEKEVASIQKHNALYLKGESKYYLGLNQYSDLEDEEFKQTYLMTKEIHRQNRPEDKRWRFEQLKVEPGTSVDWREKGVVAPVQDQGACGSCYAFAGTGAASSTYALRSNSSEPFVYGSVQEVLDCCSPPDTYCCYGCDGGEPVLIMNWMALPQGVDSSTDWPYTSGPTATTNTCDADKMNNEVSHIIQIEGGERPPQYNETAVMQALMTRPVTIDIDVEGNFRSYAGGVYDDAGCGTTIWHAVLLVGFDYTGEGEGVDYFIMQNSWGESWGEGGYMKMSMGVGNHYLHFIVLIVFMTCLPTYCTISDEPNGVCCLNCYPAIALLNEDTE